MLRKAGSIISDTARGPASSQAGDWHDFSGHHRYYGSSACNGGERIVETRAAPASRQRLRILNSENRPPMAIPGSVKREPGISRRMFWIPGSALWAAPE